MLINVLLPLAPDAVLILIPWVAHWLTESFSSSVLLRFQSDESSCESIDSTHWVHVTSWVQKLHSWEAISSLSLFFFDLFWGLLFFRFQDFQNGSKESFFPHVVCISLFLENVLKIRFHLFFFNTFICLAAWVLAVACGIFFFFPPSKLLII